MQVGRHAGVRGRPRRAGREHDAAGHRVGDARAAGAPKPHSYNTRAATRRAAGSQAPARAEVARAATGPRRRRRVVIAHHDDATPQGRTPQAGVGGDLTARESTYLHDYYYNLDNTAALTASAQRLYNATRRRMPSLSLAKCQAFLQAQHVHTLTKPVHTHVPRIKHETFRCMDELVFDLLVFKQFAEVDMRRRAHTYQPAIIADAARRAALLSTGHGCLLAARHRHLSTHSGGARVRARLRAPAHQAAAASAHDRPLF